jgi:hypothetical protein
MPRLRGVFLWFALVGGALLHGRTAIAAAVTDGADFSIELPDTLCFETPASMHDDAACAGVRVPSHGPQWPEGATGIAAATVAAGKEAIGRVMIARTAGGELIEREEDAARAVEAAAQLKRDPSVAKVEVGATKLYMTAQGLRIIRSSLDFDSKLPAGLTGRPDVPKKFEGAHEVMALALTEDATYVVVVVGPKFFESDLDPILDNALSTIWARKPLKPSTLRGLLSAIKEKRAAMILTALLVVSVVVLLLRGRAWLRRQLLGTG